MKWILLLAAWLVATPVLAAPAAVAPPAASIPPAAPTTPEDVSEAELLLRIRQAITEDMQRANLLRIRGRYLDREFEAATAAFDAVDAALQPAATDEPAAAETDAPLAPTQGSLERRWRDARDLLDILLQRRQSIEQQLALLEQKRTTHEQAADLVATGRVPAVATATGETASAAPTAAPPAAAPAPVEPRPLASPPLPGTLPAPATSAATGEELAAAPAEPPVYDSRAARAERELARVHAALRAAEHGARMTEELISLNQDERALVESGILLALRHAELLDAGSPLQPGDAVGGVAATVADARADGQRQLAQRARQAVERDRERIAVLESRLIALKSLRESVEAGLLASEAAYEVARRRLAFLQSPLAPHRAINWFVQAVPRIAVLLAVFAVVWVVGRWLARRLVDAAVTRIRRTANEERVQRVQTLRRALRSLLTVVLSVGVALIVLPEFGIDATVLLGSAAVLSLALAFGAQSLVKDYFSGFMILSENQYRIGNVVRINELSGVVEDISMRMTMLRDAEGIAHFIPHSEIRTVSNMTHGWAQAVVDVRVGYREDIDEAMRVLEALAADMQRDPVYGELIVAPPELWGVEALAESAVVVRLVLRTRPLKQWQVKRELLRRIKNRFDELGIEMPVPQLAVQVDDAATRTGAPPH